MEVDDAGATLAGACGGLLNWLTTPAGKRALAAGLVAGAMAGYGASAVLRWMHPDIPPDVRVFCAGVAGLVSLVGVSFVTDAVVRVRQKANKVVDEKLGVAPDGPTAPAPGAVHGGQPPPLVLPAADGGVPANGRVGVCGPEAAGGRGEPAVGPN